MDRARIPPVRWLGIILLSLIGLYVLSAILVRIMRRIRPGLTPLFAAPQLTMPWRWRFFGTPEQILDHAGVVPDMQVLEIGPGPGAFTVPLARRVAAHSQQGRVICVEIQPEMVAMLREHLEKAQVHNVEIIQGDGRQMSLPDDCFDLVFLADVVGETPDLPALFRECARVLKPGGILAVTEQLIDPDFRLPRTVRTLASNAQLGDAGYVGRAWWAYTARFSKPLHRLA
jgi:SAM-dependent methyltransferase